MSTQADPVLETAAPANPRLSGATRVAVAVLGVAGLVAIVVQTFNLSAFGLFPLLANRYYYLLIALFLAASFLIMPARSANRDAPANLLDWGLAVLAIGSGLYLSVVAENILTGGWDVVAPPVAAAVSGVLVALSLEAVRRSGGAILLVICGFFAAYPLFADYLPGFLWGPSLSLTETVAAHAMGMESIIGIPLRVVADTLVGFIIFGAVLNAMGGGQFFMDLSMALMGKSRGGPAKVAILSSGLFGSLSGSVISNVLTTGRLTIPAMQRAGYPPKYAAAVEACASTGGTLMPPVMGAVAFIMASFLDTSYTTIIVAALVPSVLYYLALLLQVDLYAARKGLAPAGTEDIPALPRVLAEGWHHLVSLILLVGMLFVLSPSRAAYYATVLMLMLGLLRHRRMPTLGAARDLLEDVTGNIAYLIATLCGIGLVVGSLAITGVGSAFSRELVQYGGQSVFLLLVLGALTSFVLGMGMTVSACYIFLATVLAPALVELGLSPIGAHLFVLYWGMLSYITPPVALASITAAQISGAKGLETGFTSMRLGAALFILPFVFVYEPALLLQGDPLTILFSVGSAVLALTALSCALEGHLYQVGRIGPVARLVTGVGALLLMIPDRMYEAAGLALVLGLALLLTMLNKARPTAA
ncbi:TRAP transporter, 4TM/12TM fusion protein [Thalassovita litoralis]|jgi:TRAP transporter 4TM/12TM fusion protein|uniref:TRAP transporter, 4TM/12TM fusion protein n=1 Tax=Thalassovita litoralis TaxID=1010611 RepID=A0A521B2C9_9RHOB|nr:TRAP transporter fused permease subunit [Thalassovita litoralis]SMO41258.1 TRAP transporter, 4TM/12TM fusion protein [Thalassovita litoralis]